MEKVKHDEEVDDEEEEEEEEEEEAEEPEDHDEEELETLEGERHALKTEAPEESGSVLVMDSLTLTENNSGLACNPSTRPPRSVSPAGTTTTGIRDLVSSDLTKARASQHRKYHSKRSTRRAGRPHGSKAKQDTRVKLDHSGVWD